MLDGGDYPYDLFAASTGEAQAGVEPWGADDVLCAYEYDNGESCDERVTPPALYCGVHLTLTEQMALARSFLAYRELPLVVAEDDVAA